MHHVIPRPLAAGLLIPWTEIESIKIDLGRMLRGLHIYLLDTTRGSISFYNVSDLKIPNQKRLLSIISTINDGSGPAKVNFPPDSHNTKAFWIFLLGIVAFVFTIKLFFFM
jgi:hypothetical protein